jgi:alpha-galactosidase
MDRRHFVKISGITGVGLAFSRVTFAATNNVNYINHPDEVWVLTADNWIKLAPHMGSTYSYKDIEISLKETENSRAVYASATHSPLSAIRLVWKHSTAADTKVLGDHWERSYGDLAWKTPDGKAKYPWYMLLYDGTSTACFGVKTGPKSICWWAMDDTTVSLTMDVSSAGGGVKLASRRLKAAEIMTANSRDGETPFTTAQRFCGMMCPHPRLLKQPVYGINDWYYAYGNNSPALIKEQATMMTGLALNNDNRPFSVIDAGWASYAPSLPNDCCWQDDFSKPNDKFKDMHVMADDLKKLGMRPGLWFRPLCASYKDSASLLLPKIPGRDNPQNPILDPTIEENLERVKHNISLYKQWGYEMVKHDFSTYDITGHWGFQLADGITVPGWHFYNQNITTAEAIGNLYHAIREAAGDTYIIGCNTLSHLSAGMFELNRVGDDTSGKEWARTRKMGVNTLGFRIVQNKTFYATDGDCVGLTNQVPWEKNKQWMQLLAYSGTPLFISAQPDALGAEQKAYITQCFSAAAKEQPTGEPLDWLSNQWPAKWKLDGEVVDFNWD